MIHMSQFPLRVFAVSFIAFVAATVLGTPAAVALEPDAGGWYHTGDGILGKRIGPAWVEVFAVRHDMKCLPEHRSKAEVIAIDCDKRLAWKVLRAVDKAALHESLVNAYKAVDYDDEGKVRRALAAFVVDLKEGTQVTIAYDAAKKSTTFAPLSGPRVSVSGLQFMKATWSILFANRDAKELGDALIGRL
jgi:hypothetical protein